MTSDFNLIRKEGGFLEKKQKKEKKTTFERELVVFIKIKQNIFFKDN